MNPLFLLISIGISLLVFTNHCSAQDRPANPSPKEKPSRVKVPIKSAAVTLTAAAFAQDGLKIRASNVELLLDNLAGVRLLASRASYQLIGQTIKFKNPAFLIDLKRFGLSQRSEEIKIVAKSASYDCKSKSLELFELSNSKSQVACKHAQISVGKTEFKILLDQLKYQTTQGGADKHSFFARSSISILQVLAVISKNDLSGECEIKKIALEDDKQDSVVLAPTAKLILGKQMKPQRLRLEQALVINCGYAIKAERLELTLVN